MRTTFGISSLAAPFIIAQSLYAITLTENTTDNTAGGVTCYKIETASATYYLEKDGCGLSSLVDKDGKDWIGYSKNVKGADGMFRGFPNAVHKQNIGYFHPIKDGVHKGRCNVEYKADERVSISGTNAGWHGVYDFFTDHCTFTMKTMPAGREYWFLYEGTPGGELDGSDWLVTSGIKERQLVEEFEKGDDIPKPEWIAYGDPELNRSLLLVHHEDDSHIDYIRTMGSMTVFGFGRTARGANKALKTVPQHVSIAFVESLDYTTIAAKATALLAEAPVATSARIGVQYSEPRLGDLVTPIRRSRQTTGTYLFTVRGQLMRTAQHDGMLSTLNSRAPSAIVLQHEANQ